MDDIQICQSRDLNEDVNENCSIKIVLWALRAVTFLALMGRLRNSV